MLKIRPKQGYIHKFSLASRGSPEKFDFLLPSVAKNRIFLQLRRVEDFEGDFGDFTRDFPGCVQPDFRKFCDFEEKFDDFGAILTFLERFL